MRDIRTTTWREFEDLVAAVYQANGYDVEARGGDMPDGGIDLIVRKDDKRWIVQNRSAGISFTGSQVAPCSRSWALETALFRLLNSRSN